MENSRAFNDIFDAFSTALKGPDFPEKAKILGLQLRNQKLVFDFFNRQILFDGNDFVDGSGEHITRSVKTLLCQYVLMCPEKVTVSSNKLVTFREFSNAGPLFSNFTSNTGKIIETTFTGHMETLKQQCLKLGGVIIETPAYDISARFRALHRIPIILNFNDKDDLLPAQAIFLYHHNADIYLDLKSLMSTCTYLTGLLIQTTP